MSQHIDRSRRNAAEPPSGGPAERIVMLVLADASLLNLAGLLDPFQAADRLLGGGAYDLFLCNTSPQTAWSSGNVQSIAVGDLRASGDFDTVFVCGGLGAVREIDAELLAWLRRAKRHGARIGAIGDAVPPLLACGLIDGATASVHWALEAAIAERLDCERANPPLIYNPANGALSAMGGLSTVDLALHLIAQDHGKRLAAALADLMVLSGLRGPECGVSAFLQCRVNAISPLVEKAVQLMRANIEEPLSLDEMASRLSCSKRNIQRAFQKALQTTPSAFYLTLRLTAADRMLRTGGVRVKEVALACGFRTPSHFTKVFRRQFGRTPSDCPFDAPGPYLQ